QMKGGKRINDWNESARVKGAMLRPPTNSRAAGRAQAVRHFRDSRRPYIINWDSITCGPNHAMMMSDPFRDYKDEVRAFLAAVDDTE
ncbi:MAG: proteasome accessory factor PafA2 family protein, partial [Verrucomicrobiota bacterium]